MSISDKYIQLSSDAFRKFKSAEYEEAKTLCVEALSIVLIEGDLDIQLDAKSNLADCLVCLRDSHNAEVLCREVYEGRVGLLGGNHRKTLAIEVRLGIALTLALKFDEGLATLENALIHWSELPEDTKREQVQVLNALAENRSACGEYDEAARFGYRALDNLAGIQASDELLAITLNGLAGIEANKGDYLKARSLCEEALRLRTTVFGANNVETLNSKLVLSQILTALSKHKEAYLLAKEAEGAAKVLFPMDNPFVVQCQATVGDSLSQGGSYAEAIPILRQVSSVRANRSGIDSQDTHAAGNNLAYALLRNSEVVEAKELFRTVAEWRSEQLGETHPMTLASKNGLVEALLNENSTEEALQLAKVVVREGGGIGTNHPIAMRAEGLLVRALAVSGNEQEAVQLGAELITRYDQVPVQIIGPMKCGIAHVAFANFKVGALDEAEALLRSSVEWAEQFGQIDHPQTKLEIHNLNVIESRKKVLPLATSNEIDWVL